MALPLRGARERQLEALEISLLLEGVYQRYGYDFRQYARASLRRRILGFMHEQRLRTITSLLEAVLHDPSTFQRFLTALSVQVTSLFRDPYLYRRLAGENLRDLSFRRIWHAGCSTGEEAYSTAILLEEAGLYDKSRIYATDLNQQLLQQGRIGAYRLDAVEGREVHYKEAGGQHRLRDHYSVRFQQAVFSPALKRNLVWGHHNLTSDSSFNEFHLIFCRNVLIYFDPNLQARVHRLLYESLAVGGLLVLGSRERLAFTPHQTCYEALDEREKIYRKVR